MAMRYCADAVPSGHESNHASASNLSRHLPSHADVGNLTIHVFGCTLTTTRARFVLTIGARQEPVWTVWGSINGQRSATDLGAASLEARVVVESVVAPCTLQYLLHSVTLSCAASHGHGFAEHAATVSLHLSYKHALWAAGATRRFALAVPAFAAVHRSFRPALTCSKGIWNEPDGLNWPLLRAWKASWVDLGFFVSIGFATNSSTCAAFVEQGILTHCEVHIEGRPACSGCPDAFMRPDADGRVGALVRQRRSPAHHLYQPIQNTLCLLYAQESDSQMLAAIDYDEIAPPDPAVVAQHVEKALNTPNAVGFTFPGHGPDDEEIPCATNWTGGPTQGKPVVLPKRTSEVSVHSAFGLGWQQGLANIPWQRMDSALPPISCPLRRRPRGVPPTEIWFRAPGG